MVIVDLPFELAAVVIGAVLLVLLNAARPLFVPLFESLAAIVPLVGSSIAAAGVTIVQSIEARAQAWGDDAVTPAGRAIASVPVHVSQVTQMTINVLAALVALATSGTAGAISGAVTAATGTITAAISALQSQLVALTDLAIPALQANINYIGSEGTRLYQEAQAATATAIDGLRSDFERELAAASGALSADIDALWQRTLQQIGGIEAGIANLVDQATAAVRAEVLGAINALGQRVGAVEGAIAQDLPGLSTRVGTVEGELAGIAAQAATTAATLTQEISECIDPLCDNIKPEIPNIRAAFDLLELGLLATLITDAIVEPIPAAARTDAMVVGPVDTVLNALLAPMG